MSIRNNRPGVYALKSGRKTQYIGKVKRNRLFPRIQEHKREGEIPFSKVDFVAAKKHAIAKKMEETLIRKVRPPYNRLLKKAKRYP